MKTLISSKLEQLYLAFTRQYLYDSNEYKLFYLLSFPKVNDTNVPQTAPTAVTN